MLSRPPGICIPGHRPGHPSKSDTECECQKHSVLTCHIYVMCFLQRKPIYIMIFPVTSFLESLIHLQCLWHKYFPHLCKRWPCQRSRVVWALPWTPTGPWHWISQICYLESEKASPVSFFSIGPWVRKVHTGMGSEAQDLRTWGSCSIWLWIILPLLSHVARYKLNTTVDKLFQLHCHRCMEGE